MAGIPTAFVATWGSGKPVIALGSDIDDIPQASQKPGVGYHDPMIAGAPEHGEGHNSGMPMNIVAALRLATRVHYVITNGGDHPNVVPPNAAVRYDTYLEQLGIKYPTVH